MDIYGKICLCFKTSKSGVIKSMDSLLNFSLTGVLEKFEKINEFY